MTRSSPSATPANAVIGTISVQEVDGNDITAADFTLSTIPVLLPGATTGNNTLNGTIGNDEINALAGNDTVNAGAGNDTIIGGLGNDTLNGDAGDDVFLWNANAATAASNTGTDFRDIVNGGTEGAVGDTFVINGNINGETYGIYTRAAWDAIPGNINATLNADTEIVITRGAGTSIGTFVIAELREIEEIRINGVDPTGPGGVAGGDTFGIFGDFSGTSLRPNTITINGHSGNDTLDVSGMISTHHVVFNPSGGNDTVVSKAVSATVAENSSKAMTVFSPVVSDIAKTAGPIAYSLSGADAALFSIDAATGAVRFKASPDFENPGDSDGDNVYSIAVHASDGELDAVTNVAVTVADVTGATIKGTNKDDKVNASSGPGNPAKHSTLEADTISGRKGDDTLIGRGGDDVIDGGAGNDKLDGGSGDDLLNGGSGRDTFVFSTGYGNDTVDGYSAGADMFDLSGTGVDSFAELRSLMAEVDDSVVIDFGNGDTLTILDVSVRELSRNKSDFELA